jgi:hypothetical protein
MGWPAECLDEPTCACVNATDSTCDALGWVQNSEACTIIEDRAVLSCVSTLG